MFATWHETVGGTVLAAKKTYEKYDYRTRVIFSTATVEINKTRIPVRTMPRAHRYVVIMYRRLRRAHTRAFIHVCGYEHISREGFFSSPPFASAAAPIRPPPGVRRFIRAELIVRKSGTTRRSQENNAEIYKLPAKDGRVRLSGRIGEKGENG